MVNDSGQLSAPDVTTDKRKLPSRLSGLLWGAMLVYLAWQCVMLVWMVLGHSPKEVHYDASVFAGTSGASEALSESTRLPALTNLFGLPQRAAQKVEEKPTPSQAPETSLRLRLMGVVTSADPEQAGAIIEDASRQSAYYKVGAVLPGNAELIAVYDDHVMLRRNGRDEALKFPEANDKTGGVSIAAAERTSPRRSAAQIRTPEDFMSEAERRLGENPQAALGSVGLSVVAPGKAEGYVFNGNNPMLSKLNLRKGDIIRSVNGHPLGDLSKDRRLVKELYQQGNVMVEVERDGTFFSVNYPLR